MFIKHNIMHVYIPIFIHMQEELNSLQLHAVDHGDSIPPC